MSNEQQATSAQTRIAAAVMFVLLVVTGYAISPAVESAVDAAPMTVAALTPSFEEAGQWTGEENLNQGTSGEEVAPRFVVPEDHIQAF